MSTAAAAAATGTGFLSTFVWSPTQLVAVLIVCAGRAFRHGTPLLVAILGTHKQMISHYTSNLSAAAPGGGPPPPATAATPSVMLL